MLKGYTQYATSTGRKVVLKSQATMQEHAYKDPFGH